MASNKNAPKQQWQRDSKHQRSEGTSIPYLKYAGAFIVSVLTLYFGYETVRGRLAMTQRHTEWLTPAYRDLERHVLPTLRLKFKHVGGYASIRDVRAETVCLIRNSLPDGPMPGNLIKGFRILPSARSTGGTTYFEPTDEQILVLRFEHSAMSEDDYAAVVEGVAKLYYVGRLTYDTLLVSHQKQFCLVWMPQYEALANCHKWNAEE